jgi:hypothetical protein
MRRKYAFMRWMIEPPLFPKIGRKFRKFPIKDMTYIDNYSEPLTTRIHGATCLTRPP